MKIYPCTLNEAGKGPIEHKTLFQCSLTTEICQNVVFLKIVILSGQNTKRS